MAKRGLPERRSLPRPPLIIFEKQCVAAYAKEAHTQLLVADILRARLITLDRSPPFLIPNLGRDHEHGRIGNSTVVLASRWSRRRIDVIDARSTSGNDIEGHGGRVDVGGAVR